VNTATGISSTAFAAEERRGFRPVGTPPPDGSRPPTAEEIAQARAHATLALVSVAKKLLAELAALRQHLSGS
jgi:hypothetical protein